MNAKIFLLIAVFAAFLLVFPVSSHGVIQSGAFNITYIGQDPSPAVPGKFIDLTFRAQGGNLYSPAEVTFKAIEKFPFSLAPGEEKVKNLGDVRIIGKATDKNDFLFKLRLLVDERAGEGDNAFDYTYYVGGYEFDQKLKISVSNVQSDFDVIVQEVSGDSVSLGIVNTGKNDAKSIVVSIPTQGAFETTNVNSNILGNLAAGDFTISTFKLVPLTTEKNPLKVSVSYTDTEGTRHTLEKVVSLQLNKDDQGKAKTSTGAPRFNLLTVILVLIIIALAYYAFFVKKKS